MWMLGPPSFYVQPPMSISQTSEQSLSGVPMLARSHGTGCEAHDPHLYRKVAA
jgi:hypothetical protein